LPSIRQKGEAAKIQQPINLQANLFAFRRRGNHVVKIFKRASEITSGTANPGTLLQKFDPQHQLVRGGQAIHKIQGAGKITRSLLITKAFRRILRC